MGQILTKFQIFLGQRQTKKKSKHVEKFLMLK